MALPYEVAPSNFFPKGKGAHEGRAQCAKQAVAVMRENAAALPEVPEELRAELQAALEEGLNLALEG